jgi:hypothetical protein
MQWGIRRISLAEAKASSEALIRGNPRGKGMVTQAFRAMFPGKKE